jgi:hypothetical protein
MITTISGKRGTVSAVPTSSLKNRVKWQRISTVYIVILTYIKPLEEIDAAIPAHVE